MQKFYTHTQAGSLSINNFVFEYECFQFLELFETEIQNKIQTNLSPTSIKKEVKKLNSFDQPSNHTDEGTQYRSN